MENNTKSNSTKIGLIVAALVVVLGIGAAVYALTMPSDETDTNQTATETSQPTADTSEDPAAVDATENAVGSTVITFTDDGFDKSNYSAKAGEAVTVTNDSSMDVQFSSDDHPSHRENTELNMATLSPGESGTFTPPGAGSYDFHDHINDQFTGTLTVE